MIGKLSGIIDTIYANALILDVGGVGYVVQCSSRTLSRIGQAGDTASLFIETQVREDSITLFGFLEAGEQTWFKLLTSVQGVGAKAGLSILNVCPPDKLAMAITAQDKVPLRQADGVGPKLATRILTELKDKAGTIALSAPQAPRQIAPTSESVQGAQSPEISADAVSALTNLGYGRSEAYGAVMSVMSESAEQDTVSLDHLIKQALKTLAA